MRQRGTARFLRRTFQKALAFSLLFSLALILLYALGNYQGFLDATQFLLLEMTGVTLWAACLSSVGALVMLVVTGVSTRRFAWFQFVAALLAFGLSGALVAMLQFLTAWLHP